MTLDLPRRFPWPTLLSVCIHGAVVAGLIYTSVHQVIDPVSFLYPPSPPTHGELACRFFFSTKKKHYPTLTRSLPHSTSCLISLLPL
ncbi:hypothetical protein OU632_11390, partial [Escherichia coli]|nr:hypothetical protein [Escherichia coli]